MENPPITCVHRHQSEDKTLSLKFTIQGNQYGLRLQHLSALNYSLSIQVDALHGTRQPTPAEVRA